MKLSDFISLDRVIQLSETSMEGVFTEIASEYVRLGLVSEEDHKYLVKAFVNREELGPTGVGGGVGLPHTDFSPFENLVGVVAVSYEGLEFSRCFGSEKVDLLFPTVYPPVSSRQDNPDLHLAACQAVCNFLKSTPDFHEAILDEPTPETLRKYIGESTFSFIPTLRERPNANDESAS